MVGIDASATALLISASPHARDFESATAGLGRIHEVEEQLTMTDQISETMTKFINAIERKIDFLAGSITRVDQHHPQPSTANIVRKVVAHELCHALNCVVSA